ncbi:MAG: cyclopropane-fatty-acyl-phospholipid synthase family protein [Pseudomonadota bacterium]
MAENNEALLSRAEQIAREIARLLDANLSLRLWDGQVVPLGKNVTSELCISISSPGVISSLLRWPSLDRLIRHYALGQIDLEGGTLLDVGRALEASGDGRKRLKGMSYTRLARQLWPFLLAPSERPGSGRSYSGDEDGGARKQAENRDFIQFHYDVGNDFYALFLDQQLIYSCAYFTEPDNTIDQAQVDKLSLICRKLRLKPGDRFLDIGCGWGALILHAAEHYGVTAHGITLSEAQLAEARRRIAAKGLSEQVTVELRDYADINGTYDKIASVGMYEHIGIANIDTYFRTVRRALAPDGLFLNHAISRRAKRKQRRFSARAEQRALQKYIFPGGELDDIGHTVAAMEQAGFEVHDVEGLRWHYARTTELWCQRLRSRRDEAVALVGEQTYRIWLAYLAACSLAFERGSARIFQTLASKSAKGRPPLPATRADLYRD